MVLLPTVQPKEEFRQPCCQIWVPVYLLKKSNFYLNRKTAYTFTAHEGVLVSHMHKMKKNVHIKNIIFTPINALHFTFVLGRFLLKR